MVVLFNIAMRMMLILRVMMVVKNKSFKLLNIVMVILIVMKFFDR